VSPAVRPMSGLPHATDGDLGADGVAFLLDAAQRLGPWFTVMVDGEATVVAGSSSAAEELFIAERDSLEVFNTALVHDLFGRAVFNLTGTGHRAARRLLRPPLSGRSLEAYLAPLLGQSLAAAERWAARPIGDLHQESRRLTLAMSGGALLGLSDGDPDLAVFRGRFEVFAAATAAPGGRRRYLSARYWAGRRARADLIALFSRRATRADARPDHALPGLDSAFQSTDPVQVGVLGDHLLALLIASRETTASLVTWCLIELAAHSEIADQATDEAHRALSEPRLLLHRADLPLLHSVVAETLRLHSPNLLSIRRTTCPVDLGGHSLPTGTRVAYSSAATSHFDAAVFEEPFAFRPERFQPGGTVGTADLLAFGAGAHACLGRPLAELMTLAALTAALAQGRPVLPAGPPAEVRFCPAKAPAAALPFALRSREPAA
jgi:cytochrome P450